jgi:excisionase family DNA binding protein
MSSPSPVMTAKEVADLLRVNIKSIYEAARNNAIPCRRMGRRLLFSRRAIMAWLREQGHVTLERSSHDSVP